MASAPKDISDHLSRLTISDPDIELLRDQGLGKGSYGRVFKVRYHGSMCAAKEIHSILIDTATSEHREKLQDSFMHECYHCSKLNHPNIVRFIGIYHHPLHIFPVMIMELMDESLTTYVEKPNICFNIKLSLLHDVAEGLNYLHSRNPSVIHRDLSPNNILLKHPAEHVHPVGKIADLGVAKVFTADGKSSKSCQTKVPGTPDFMPLEAFADKPKYDTSLDIFSYGGIILYIVNREWPKPSALAAFDPVTRQVRGFSEVERRQEYLKKMTGEAEVLRLLVEACLDNDPVKRPSIVELSEKIKSLKVHEPKLLSVPDLDTSPLVKSSSEEKTDWFKLMMKEERFGIKAPVWMEDKSVSMCMVCAEPFTVLFRRHHCRGCGRVLCTKCSQWKVYLPYLRKADRVCFECYHLGSGQRQNSLGQIDSPTTIKRKKGLLSLSGSQEDNDTVISGYLHYQDGHRWTKHWYMLRRDMVLYSFKAPSDIQATKSIPLPGYVVTKEKYKEMFLIRLKHPGGTHSFKCTAKEEWEKWYGNLTRACKMEFSPEPHDEHITSDYTKQRLEGTKSDSEKNSLEDTNSLGHRDSISKTDSLGQSDSSSFTAQDCTIDTGISNSDDN